MCLAWILTISKTGTDFQMQCVMVDGEPWFRGKEVAELLGYTNTTKAIRDHVRDKHKGKLEELVKSKTLPLEYHTGTAIFINEAGLYSLILRSHQEQAIRLYRFLAKIIKFWPKTNIRPTYIYIYNILYPDT